MRRNFNLVFTGAKQAGCISLLALLALGCDVKAVVSFEDIISRGMKVCAATEDVGAIMGAYSTQQLTPTATSEGGNINPQVGYVMEKAADTFHAVIFLTISP